MTAADRRVLLVSGAPGAGKTTLARALAAALGFEALTLDEVYYAIGAVTAYDTHPAFHEAARFGHIRYFTEGPKEKLVADAQALETAMWPAIDRLIRIHTSWGTPVVLDWYLMPIHRVAEIEDDAVASVWLHIDPTALDRRERRQVEFRAGSPDPERMHANYMHRSLWRNDQIDTEARRLGLPVIEQPGDRSVADLVVDVVRRIGRGGDRRTG